MGVSRRSWLSRLADWRSAIHGSPRELTPGSRLEGLIANGVRPRDRVPAQGAGPGTDGGDPKALYTTGRRSSRCGCFGDVGQIAVALVAHLSRPDGSKVSISVEIEAEADSGLPEDLRRVVSENARTLRFETSELES